MSLHRCPSYIHQNLLNPWRSCIRENIRSTTNFPQSTKKTVSEEKQLFPSRRMQKEIERRIRTVRMDCMIMNDMGITDHSKKDDYRLSNVSVISSHYLSANSSKFGQDISAIKSSDILDRNKKNVEILSKRAKESKDVRLPLGKFKEVEFSKTNNSKSSISNSIDTNYAYDRGFHVEGDVYTDEYVAGALSDLPAEAELKDETIDLSPITTESDGVDRGEERLPYRIRFGPEDAVEQVDLLHPHQQFEPRQKRFNWFQQQRIWNRQALEGRIPQKSIRPRKEIPLKRILKRDDDLDTGFGEETESEAWKQHYGSANPSVKPADEKHRCGGCGATFHCQDSSLPGFLPASSFLKKQEADDFSGIECRRCYLLNRHQFLVNVNVSPIDYERVLGHLRTVEEALIILLVDMTDFPACIYPKLPDYIGHGKPTIVVGNKVDLLPPDTETGYLNHFARCLRRTIKDIGFMDSMNILDFKMISAKTGYGIEQLISSIFNLWGNKGDIYLIGCTNTGKSTLFNALLQSDVCKVRATDLLERATASLWPGTTLNLLKFPVINPNRFRLVERNKRLNLMRQVVDAEEEHRRVLLEQTGDSKYAVLQGIVDRTPNFDTPEEGELREKRVIEESDTIIQSKLNLEHPDFQIGRWCYDTPGTVHHEQIINYLTLDELIKTVPRSMLRPRTFTLGRRETMFIGGLVRIDHFDGPSGSFLTIFASDGLPIYVEDTNRADELYKKYIGTAAMAVPYGDKKRLAAFPPLQRQEVKLVGLGPQESCADVTLSSAGWMAVTSPNGEELTLRVWTPGGVGVYVRTPPLLPFIVKERGKRIGGTNEYEGQPMIKFAEKQSGSQ